MGSFVLAGISQGAATNVHTLLNLNLEGNQVPRRLGAFLGFVQDAVPGTIIG